MRQLYLDLLPHPLCVHGVAQVRFRCRREVLRLMSKAGVIGGIFGIIMVGAVLYLSMGLSQQTCEVCVEFNGRTQCRTASGTDEKTAIITARDNACAFLVMSKTDAFLCGQTQPTKVTCK